MWADDDVLLLAYWIQTLVAIWWNGIGFKVITKWCKCCSFGSWRIATRVGDEKMVSKFPDIDVRLFAIFIILNDHKRGWIDAVTGKACNRQLVLSDRGPYIHAADYCPWSQPSCIYRGNELISSIISQCSMGQQRSFCDQKGIEWNYHLLHSQQQSALESRY